ncbi:MORN repeat-containing protein 3 isoform X3 [Psammomys obesus]|uniref:MORN repeat-containing protein 3 isoform X3 n=1 Tax=Psammomys obesus TaxID=48139 RepID=UPI0024534320|nr:MORN repeat-containing protein 3 isoform X3 [Psammomys obesus]
MPVAEEEAGIASLLCCYRNNLPGASQSCLTLAEWKLKAASTASSTTITEAPIMPVTKYPKKAEPLWKKWEQKAQKNGRRHQVFAVNGDHYEGEWSDNLKHGKGTQFLKKSGVVYEGDWKFGKQDGYGILSHPDPETGKYRRVYSGWWKGGKKSGYGIQFFGPKEYYEENGNRYEGNWERGMKNGRGRFFHLDHGQLFEGFWVDDVAKCGTMIDFGRDEAPEPTQFPIPKVEILDPDGVLKKAIAKLMNPEEGHN